MAFEKYLDISKEVLEARAAGRPIVALESTIISHGMPYPENLETAKSLEAMLRKEGVAAATIALMDGVIKVGLSPSELEALSREASVVKVSRRDFGRVIARKQMGATTVAATLMVCHMAGIRVFATGGIGGVHRDVAASWDISADLRELSLSSTLCVSSGVKSILDIKKTLEALETLGVPVMTWRSGDFPAFYCQKSGELSPSRVDEAIDCARELATGWDLGLPGGALLAVPIPEEHGLLESEMEGIIERALAEASEKSIAGKGLTPFLLKKVNAFSQGRSLKANRALIRQNVAVAAKVAVALSSLEKDGFLGFSHR